MEPTCMERRIGIGILGDGRYEPVARFIFFWFSFLFFLFCTVQYFGIGVLGLIYTIPGPGWRGDADGQETMPTAHYFWRRFGKEKKTEQYE